MVRTRGQVTYFQRYDALPFRASNDTRQCLRGGLAYFHILIGQTSQQHVHDAPNALWLYRKQIPVEKHDERRKSYQTYPPRLIDTQWSAMYHVIRIKDPHCCRHDGGYEVVENHWNVLRRWSESREHIENRRRVGLQLRVIVEFGHTEDLGPIEDQSLVAGRENATHIRSTM